MTSPSELSTTVPPTARVLVIDRYDGYGITNTFRSYYPNWSFTSVTSLSDAYRGMALYAAWHQDMMTKYPHVTDFNFPEPIPPGAISHEFDLVILPHFECHWNYPVLAAAPYDSISPEISEQQGIAPEMLVSSEQQFTQFVEYFESFAMVAILIAGASVDETTGELRPQTNEASLQAIEGTIAVLNTHRDRSNPNRQEPRRHVPTRNPFFIRDPEFPSVYNEFQEKLSMYSEVYHTSQNHRTSVDRINGITTPNPTTATSDENFTIEDSPITGTSSDFESSLLPPGESFTYREDERSFLDLLTHAIKSLGLIVAVTAAKGGVGKTFVTYNLAMYAYHLSVAAYNAGLIPRPLRILMFEGDLYDPQWQYPLALRNTNALRKQGIEYHSIYNTFAGMTVSLDRLMKNSVTQDVRAVGGGIDVVLAPTTPERAKELPCEYFQASLQELRHAYDIIFVDTSVNYILDPVVSEVFYPMANRIYMVTKPELMTMGSNANFLRIALGTNYDEGHMGISSDRIRVVANQVIAPPKDMTEEEKKQRDKFNEQFVRSIAGLDFTSAFPQSSTITTNAINARTPYMFFSDPKILAGAADVIADLDDLLGPLALGKYTHLPLEIENQVFVPPPPSA